MTVGDVSRIHEEAGPLAAISRRVREREIRRQLRHNDARKMAVRARAALRRFVSERTPALAREFLETLLGAALGFFVIGWLLAHFAGIGSLYTFSVFGLLYSAQATYYKRKLALDPGFRIPSCRCAGRRADGTEGVLQSRQSAVLGIPNSAFAVAFFCMVLVTTVLDERRLALPPALAVVVASIYLSYVMLTKLRSLCAICLNIAALNVLIFWQLLS